MPQAHTAPSFLLLGAFALCTASTASAQYFMKHVPEGYGGTLRADGGGGVRMTAYVGHGREIALDAAGNIIGDMRVDQDPEGANYLKELVPYGPGARLAFGNWDDSPNAGVQPGVMLARIPDGATTMDAVVLGRPDNFDYASDIAVLQDQVVVMGRSGYGPSTDMRYKLVVGKFDTELQLDWITAVDVLEKNMQPRRIFVDPVSGEITCFSIMVTPGPVDYSGSLVTLSPEGEVLWSYAYDHEGNGWTNSDIVRSEAGDFYVLHQVTDVLAFYMVLSKISPTGELLWSKRIDSAEPANLVNMRLHEGSLYAAATAGSTGGYQRPLLMKMDLEGNVLWAHVYGVTDRLIPVSDMLISPDAKEVDAIWVSGAYRFNGTSPADILWMKVDINGEGLDCTYADPTFTTTPTTTTRTADGSLLAFTDVGTATLHIGTEPAVDPVSVCLGNGLAETTTTLAQIAPVPTNGPCTITLSDGHGALRLRVIDALGRSVHEQNVAAGTNAVRLDLGTHRAGTYLLTIHDERSGRYQAERIVKE